MVQTIETGGKRRIRLLQRRRWSIRSEIANRREIRIEECSLPVFNPESGQWTRKLFTGTTLTGFQVEAALPADFNAPTTNDARAGRVSWIGVFIATVCILAWIFVPQLRFRSLRKRMLSRISRIRFSRP